jgi:hypothetical protein
MQKSKEIYKSLLLFKENILSLDKVGFVEACIIWDDLWYKIDFKDANDILDNWAIFETKGDKALPIHTSVFEEILSNIINKYKCE